MRPTDDSAIHAQHVESMPASTRMLRTMLRAALALLVIGVGIRWPLDIGAFLIVPHSGYDFTIYYTAALALRGNPAANIYDAHVLVSVAHAHHIVLSTVSSYVYPPVLALALIPLTVLPLNTAFALWSIFNLALLLGCAILLAKMLHLCFAASECALPSRGAGGSGADVRFLVYALVIFMVLNYEPMREGIELGQVNVIICFLVLLAIWKALGKRQGLAGVLLAVAIWLKVYPAVMIVYYALRGRKRLVASTLATGVAGGLAIVAALGVQGALMMTGFLSAGGGMASQYHNQALMRAPMWLAVEFGAQPGPLAEALGYVLIAAVGALFVAGVVLARRLPVGSATTNAAVPPSPLGDACNTLFGALWALSTMVLVAPLAWEHHYTWVLPACIVGFGYTLSIALLSHGRRAQIWLALTFAAGYVLTMPDLPLGYDGDYHFDLGPFVAGHPVRPLLMLIRPLGALLIWAATGVLFWRTRSGTGYTQPTAEALGDGNAVSATTPAPSAAQVTRRIGVVLLSFLVAVAVMRALLVLPFANLH